MGGVVQESTFEQALQVILVLIQVLDLLHYNTDLHTQTPSVSIIAYFHSIKSPTLYFIMHLQTPNWALFIFLHLIFLFLTDTFTFLVSDYDQKRHQPNQASLSFPVPKPPSQYYSHSFFLYSLTATVPVQALIISYLDYWNCFLTSFPASSTYSLQSIIYIADSLIFLKCKPGHKLPLLRFLQWLTIEF